MERLLFLLSFAVATSARPSTVRDLHCTECRTDPDTYRDVGELIKNRGYPLEQHYVDTTDGFILSVQRIPHGRGERAGPGRPVVFLQHGLLADATNWVQNWAWDSLGYILADSGFDVWLGNVRGNRYSRRHQTLKPSDKEFWNWSFQEMAEYDIPAMLEHALQISGQSQLFYVGHSQGTLVGFTAFSSNPELAKKVKMFFALAPVFYLNHTSAILRDAAYTLYPLEEILRPLGEAPFLPGTLFRLLARLGFCGQKWSEVACYRAYETIFGFDDADMNMTRVPVYLANFPSGTSFKNLIHFGQLVYFGKCNKYDYGKKGDVRHYNQTTPPAYNVERMTTPTAFFLGGHDRLANKVDVLALAKQISNLVAQIEFPEWNHTDFLFGVDAPKRLFALLVKMMKEQL